MIRSSAVWFLTCLLCAGAAWADDGLWTHRGNTAARNSISPGVPPDITASRFVASSPEGWLVGQSAPVVADHMIFVYGEKEVVRGDAVVTVNEVLAFSEIDGHLLWSEPVGDKQWDSHTAPTVDPDRGNVLIASGTDVTALDMATGGVAWETTPGTKPVVNSSICVLGDLAFIIDYTGALPEATLYALNLAPDHPTFEAGEIAWTQPISKCSGCEVAVDLADGPMLVATDSDGYLRQFTNDGGPGWTFAVPGAGSFFPPPPFGAFFGGATVADGRVYAATYEYYGGENSARLYCVDAATGAEIWAEPSERSDTIPIVTDSLVILSGGIDGYGSAAKVEAFDKATGAKQWQWTGGGGWTAQPVLVGDRLYGGVLPVGDDHAPCTDLYALDITKLPTDPEFVVGHFAGAGSSPAFANGNIYTIGAAGLYAFGPPVTVAGDPAVEVATEDGLGWVYQNTPRTLSRGGHRVGLTVTVTDLNGNDSVTVAVSKQPGSGTGEVDVQDGATGLERIVYGSDRGLDADGSLTLDVVVTGNVSGSTTVSVPFSCRKLGDVDGNGGAEPSDVSLLIMKLNGLPPAGYHDQAFDIDANGGAEPSDVMLVINILNGLTVP